MRKLFFTTLVWLLLAGLAHASPTACNAISATGAVTSCNPSQVYGCNAGGASVQILAPDGGRTSIWFQNNGAVPVSLNFGDSAATLTNGFLVQPGLALIWTNMPQGNTPGRVASTNINIVTGGNAASCVFMYTD